MDITQQLNATPNSNRQFAAYYREECKKGRYKMSVTDFLLQLSFEFQLGVWLDFLSTYGLAIEASIVGFKVYALNDSEAWSKFGFKPDDTGVYIIQDVQHGELKSIVDSYSIAVLECLEYLNNPENYLKNKPPF